MNSKERIKAVIALEEPDRVPVGPLIDHFAATYAGITKQTIIEDDKKRINAVLKTMEDLGPWDITFMGEMANKFLLTQAPTRVLWPGKDLPEDEIHQFDDFELLTPNDYDMLCELGLFRFLKNVTNRIYPGMGYLKLFSQSASYAFTARKQIKMVRKAGAEPAVGFVIPGPLFEYFSIGRGMTGMAMDLYDHPEKIKAAGRIWAKYIVQGAIKMAKFVGVNRMFIGLARCSPSMISPKHFEEFALPEVDHMVNILIGEGITPVFHMDTNWTRSLELFRRFPAKKCIMELDGDTDIFKAKEIVGDRMCIMGDVPAYLLAFKEKDDVMAYCKRLIDEVGKGGGFILSTGCSIPANAKPENVRALFEAADKWGWY